MTTSPHITSPDQSCLLSVYLCPDSDVDFDDNCNCRTETRMKQNPVLSNRIPFSKPLRKPHLLLVPGFSHSFIWITTRRQNLIYIRLSSQCYSALQVAVIPPKLMIADQNIQSIHNIDLNSQITYFCITQMNYVYFYKG